MKRIILAIVVPLTLAGCGPEETQPMYDQAKQLTYGDPRVQVTRIGVFRDDLAYQNGRGIYIIKDTQTGQEYLGVSGIGISALGSHSCGKNCITKDER